MRRALIHTTQGASMAIIKFGDDVPQVPASAWVADSASVIGRVELGEDANIWYGAVVRGDNDLVRLGRGTNVQENSVLHTDAGIVLTVGDHVTVGHQVMLHGCTIGDGSLIGIQAVILNNVRIGRNCIVGAGALVTEGKEFPDGSLIVGSPAKVVRQLDAAQIERLLWTAQHYVELAQRHRSRAVRVA
jgi:carbonic anhydrase/acetyltransferase-like protein (isoleucine patch superfamily)